MQHRPSSPAPAPGAAASPRRSFAAIPPYPVLSLLALALAVSCGPPVAQPGGVTSGSEPPAPDTGTSGTSGASGPTGIADHQPGAPTGPTTGGPEPTGEPTGDPGVEVTGEPIAEPTGGPVGPAGPAGRMAGILEAHNQVRANHCAPPMSWSEKVAASAQRWADQLRDSGCAFDHGDTEYGENLAFYTPVGRVDGAGAVGDWYREVELYDFGNPGFSPQVGHFTQVVWTNTRELGCGVATCNGGELWVCRYHPSGNYRGQYGRHVLPTSCQ